MSNFEEFQEFRKILCVCPGCGEIVRVSDLKLTIKGTGTRTWLDDYQTKITQIEKAEENFENRKDTLRKKSVDKGRIEAEKIFNKSISPTFRKLKLNPHDIESILHPVDYVVFKGMTLKNEVSSIDFLSHVSTNKSLQLLREQIKNVIKEKKFEWEIARISDKGKIKTE